jgi:hypothetical protein
MNHPPWGSVRECAVYFDDVPLDTPPLRTRLGLIYSHFDYMVVDSLGGLILITSSLYHRGDPYQ